MVASRQDPLENVLERAIADSDGKEKVTIGELLDLFGDRSFGPLLSLLGLIVVLPPIGAIPVLPAVVGVAILLLSVQIVFGAEHVWMPGFIENRSIERDKLLTADDKAHPWLARIDRLITERLTWATGPISTRLAGVMTTLLGLALVPLELVPFAVALAGWPITLFGLALMARDGALMLAGFTFTAVALVGTIIWVPWGQVAGWFN